MKKIELDYIRAFAIIFVISVHSLSNIGFYGTVISGSHMLIAEFLRVMFVTCVPLFLLLSGYLQSTKAIVSKEYYVKIIKVLFVYILSGILCQLALIVFGEQEFGFETIISFFNFTASPYGWYIEMYVGLFALMPFLNKIWNSIDEHEKKVLIISLILVITIATIFSNFNIKNGDWWHSSNTSYTKIGVEFWYALYPVLYYFCGAFIRENESKINAYKLAPLFIVLVVVFGTINYFKNYQMTFPWNKDTSYEGYQCLIISVLEFCLLLKINPRFGLVNSVMSFIAQYSLGTYLISYIADRIVYKYYGTFFNTFESKLTFIFVPILLVLFMSLAGSVLVTKISNVFYRIAVNGILDSSTTKS